MKQLKNKGPLSIINSTLIAILLLTSGMIDPRITVIISFVLLVGVAVYFLSIKRDFVTFKKYFKTVAIAVIVAAGIIFFLRALDGAEDTWICSGGSWVKHGNPTATMPTSPCK